MVDHVLVLILCTIPALWWFVNDNLQMTVVAIATIVICHDYTSVDLWNTTNFCICICICICNKTYYYNIIVTNTNTQIHNYYYLYKCILIDNRINIKVYIIKLFIYVCVNRRVFDI